jgi:hypothetical protein
MPLRLSEIQNFKFPRTGDIILAGTQTAKVWLTRAAIEKCCQLGKQMKQIYYNCTTYIHKHLWCVWKNIGNIEATQCPFTHTAGALSLSPTPPGYVLMHSDTHVHHLQILVLNVFTVMLNYL